VLSETWNYPSWLFVESAHNSSSDEADLDPDRDCGDAEIVVVECNPVRHPDPGQDDSDSEDEGWYSLSRTDVRKLQEVRSAGERCDVNIILTNPDIDILHLCAEEDEEEDDEDERKQESSPERTSYSSLSSGDSGQLSSEGAKLPGHRKSSDTDSGLSPGSPGPGSGSQCSCSSHESASSPDISCDNEDSCAHKITVYVKYSEISPEAIEAAPLVEGCVDSEGEEPPGASVVTDTVVTCDNDTITICDTRVRLRLCAPKIAASLRHSKRGRRGGGGQGPHIIPVKRKDLFKLLGLNESSDVLDPSEEADAKKVALQNFLCSADKSDNTVKRTGDVGDGILLAPKQGKKNLAKFLGIDMSALPGEAEQTAHNTNGPQPGTAAAAAAAQGVALDAESVSLSSSTTSGGRRPGARQILGLAIPGMRASSRGASLENSVMEEIPEQLRTPKVPQANRKDLQRFLGLNDSEEMVYIRNVRRPARHEHRGPGGSRLSRDCSSAGTISSVCSCVVCSTEYSVTSESGPARPDPGPAPDTAQDRLSEALVEHNCGNDKCIMCGPGPDTRERLGPGASSERRAVSAGPGVNNNNNNKEAGERVTVRQIQSPGPRLLSSSVPPPPPPLPKKTVAPYQEYKFGLEEAMPSAVENGRAQPQPPVTAGKDKRRKKQATKRMEQLIKIHTENVELSDGGGDDVVEPRCDQQQQHQQQLKLVRTLDRSDAAQAGQARGRRLHKRSILKHHSKEPDSRGGEARASLMTRPSNMKVKFAGSLRKREQSNKLNRRKMISHPCQVHFPWHPDYLDMSHILAVVHPRYLQHHMHK